MKKNIIIKFIILIISIQFVDSQTTNQITLTSWSNTSRYIMLWHNGGVDIYSNDMSFLHTIPNVAPEPVQGPINTGSFRGFSWNFDDTKLALTLDFEGAPVDGSYGNYDYIIVYDVFTWDIVLYKIRFSNTWFPAIFKPNSNILTISFFDYSDVKEHIKNYDIETGALVSEFDTNQILFFSWNPQEPDTYIRTDTTIKYGNSTTLSELDTGISLGVDSPPKFNFNGSKIAVINRERNIDVYDSNLSQILHTIDGSDDIFSFNWYGDDIITISFNDVLEEWNLETDESLILPGIAWKTGWNKTGTQVATIQNGDVTFYTDIMQTNIVGQILSSSTFYTSSLVAVENGVNNLIGNNSKIGNANVTQIQANVTGSAQSVRFFLNGNPIIDNEAPYTIPLPPAGTYTLSATPYSEADALGDAGVGFTVNFEVVEGIFIPTPTLTRIPPTATPTRTPTTTPLPPTETPYYTPTPALCDGIIVLGRTTFDGSGGGGSASQNAAAGLSLRCFANDPFDTDNDGFRNLSNIVIVYNHLLLTKGFQPGQPGGPYQIALAGEVIAESTGYSTRSGIPVISHLDLQIYLANGYQTTSAIQLNPRLMFKEPLARPYNEQILYPSGYDEWWLQGRLEGYDTFFWQNTALTPPFIRDIANYLITVYPNGSYYSGPNCENLPSNYSQLWNESTDYNVFHKPRRKRH